MAEELGLGYVRLVPSMRGFSSEASKGLKEIDGPAESAGKESGRRFGSGFSGAISTAFKAAALAGGAAAGTFAVKAIGAASDLNENISKVDTVFGKSGAAIQAWSKTTASSIGLSRNEALEAAGSFGNMFTQLGIGTKQSQKMSTGLVTLAADFASFHNADISDVLDAQQAAFRGEYDSLQRFLPLINAATVEQKAMQMTGKANAKALTQQEKALAVNALMLEGAGKAQGDFARTSGGLANQMRILKAQASDFAANAGQVLIPIVLEGIRVFRDIAAVIKTNLGPALEFLGGAAAEIFSILFKGDFTGKGPFSEDSPFISKVFDVRDALIGFGATVKDLVDKVLGWWNGFTSSFGADSDKAGTTANKLMGLVAGLRDLFISAFGAIRATVTTVIDFVQGVWRVFGDDLVSFTREFVASVLETFRGVINTLTGIFDLIKAVLTGRWGDAWTALKKILDGVWDTIFGVIRNAVTNVIPTILAGLGQIVSSIARTAFDGLKEAFKGAMNWIIDKWNGFKIPGIKVAGVTVSPEVNFPDLPRFAAGGMVEDTGPVFAHRGEAVFTPGELANLHSGIAASQSAGGSPAAVAIKIAADSSSLFTEWLRHTIRLQGGGNVQLALGQ